MSCEGGKAEPRLPGFTTEPTHAGWVHRKIGPHTCVRPNIADHRLEVGDGYTCSRCDAVWEVVKRPCSGPPNEASEALFWQKVTP